MYESAYRLWTECVRYCCVMEKDNEYYCTYLLFWKKRSSKTVCKRNDGKRYCRSYPERKGEYWIPMSLS